MAMKDALKRKKTINSNKGAVNQNKKVLVEREGVINSIRTLFTEKSRDKVPIWKGLEKSEGKVELPQQNLKMEKRRNPFWESDPDNTAAHPT
jgi:hypothetical protein